MPYVTFAAALYLLPLVLAALSCAIVLHSRQLRKEGYAATRHKLNHNASKLLARRAEQLRTRELRQPSASGFYIELLRVVPVMQRGELARPIIVRDWRPNS
jgi:hypothetical protein